MKKVRGKNSFFVDTKNTQVQQHAVKAVFTLYFSLCNTINFLLKLSVKPHYNAIWELVNKTSSYGVD